MRNSQDHNAAIALAVSIVSHPERSPSRSQIFNWLEDQAQKQQFPRHWNLEELASTGLKKIENIRQIERKGDFLQYATLLVGTLAFAFAIFIAILSALEIVHLPGSVLLSFILLAAICAINWSFGLLGMLPQINTSNRSDLHLNDAERTIVWHIGEFGPLP